MKTIAQTSLALTLLFSYGCGPGNTFTPQAVAKQMEEKIIAQCKPASTHNVSEADRTVVVLNYEMVQGILDNLGNGGTYDISLLWSVLSEEDRNILNFAVNSSLKKQSPEEYMTVYRATAMFLNKVLGNYKKGHDYRIKDISGKVISFVNSGVANAPIEDISSTCDSNSGLDLSYIKVPQKLILIGEVKNLVMCRVKDNGSFRLMIARNSFMLMSGDRIYKAKLSEGVLKESARRLSIKIDSPELKLVLKMKKNSALAIGDRVGNKTELKVSAGALVVDEIGACHEQ